MLAPPEFFTGAGAGFEASAGLLVEFFSLLVPSSSSFSVSVLSLDVVVELPSLCQVVLLVLDFSGSPNAAPMPARTNKTMLAIIAIFL